MPRPVKDARTAVDNYKRGIEAIGGVDTYYNCAARHLKVREIAQCLRDAKARKTLDARLSEYIAAYD